MDKLKFETKSGSERNINKIAELFPEVITEARDKEGNLVKSVNLDTLKNLFGSTVEGRAESYDFTWVGKREAMIEAGTPIRKTLRPIKADSKDWDRTQNLYIEGDNLDVLKLLTDSYLGKVKMIYIDPPYNTGKDFVYSDKFTMDKDDYDDETERVDEDGNINFKENSKTNPRFHSDWCSMIYPRLKVARNLLSDDGVIFISIDDNEVHNLRKICDEIFGESNFVGCFHWKKKSTSTNVANATVSPQTDYQICYAKRNFPESLNRRETTTEQRSYPFSDELGNYRTAIIEKKDSGGYARATMKFPILEMLPRNGKRWQIGEKRAREYEKMNRFLVDNGTIKLKIYEQDDKSTFSANPTLILDCGSTDSAAKETNVGLLGKEELFSNPKPTELLLHLMRMGTSADSIILDFFSGSATTAHAVMQLNAEDGGTRKFIMVQLPEATDEKGEAYKAGYKNICEIGKERIRRAGAKIADENRMTAPDLDTGFRVFKLDESNFKDVHFSAGQVTQMSSFDTLAENLKEDRTAEDLLYSCILEWGLPLTLTHTEETIEGKKVYVVNGGDLIACFESELPESVIKAIAARKPLNALFRESCFKDSPAKINNEEIFKLISPSTKVKVL